MYYNNDQEPIIPSVSGFLYYRELVNFDIIKSNQKDRGAAKEYGNSFKRIKAFPIIIVMRRLQRCSE